MRLKTPREPGRARWIAQVLWITWAIVVWNVVFDHVIVVAGRAYLAAATAAARVPGTYAQMDDWMRPAIARGLWTATAASAAILVLGLLAIRLAKVRDESQASMPQPLTPNLQPPTSNLQPPTSSH